MSRYIDADKLNIDFYDEYETEDDEYVYRYVSEHQIDEAPSIDIVRCRECRLGGTEDCPMDEIDDEYFCNFGEREGE